MKNQNEIVSFIDENVLKKAETVEQFKTSVDTVANYVRLKGPLDDTTVGYFNALKECADEIMAMKKKGVIISTETFYQLSKDKVTEAQAKKEQENHYGSGCASDHSYTYHYNSCA